jgi:multiphosphoryl transfer protein
MTAEVLSADAVRVGGVALDRHDAIEQVGALLVAHGFVTPAYIAGMHDREEVVSTYLGNGVALPHGTNEAKDAILSTGLAVIQFPAGVPWGDEPARLVIGLAATGEEHLEVLSRLATILGDADTCDRLARSSDPVEIHATLTGPAPDDPAADRGPSLGGLRRTARITNPSGLHARPAAQIVARLQPLDAEVAIEVNGRRADARSITAALGLGASVGDDVTITSHGPDAEAAMDAVLAVVTHGSDL